MALNHPPTIDSLTGLRFIAALSVLVGHAAVGVMTFSEPASFVGFFTHGPAIGMPLFFVLSGFVIHYNYGETFRNAFATPLVDFFIARFSRLYPLYLVLLVLFIFNQRMIFGIVTGNYDLTIFPRYLLLWQAWTIEYRGTTWFGHLLLPPAWSISVEVFFYALYPFLAGYLLRIRKVGVATLILGGLIAAYYLITIVCYLNFEALRIWGNDTFQINADPQNALLGWLLNTGPIGRCFEFLMGALVAQIYLRLADRPPNEEEHVVGSVVLIAAVSLLLAFYVGSLSSSFLSFASSYPGGMSALFAVIIFCCARYQTPFSRALSTPTMVRLGDASYSIYLLHFFSLQLFSLVTPFSLTSQSVVVWLLQVLGAVLFTIVLSLGTYRVIEAPSRSWLRRHLGQWKKLQFASLVPDRGPVGAMASALVVGAALLILAAFNRPAPVLINVTDATYGQNCSAFQPRPPATNLFRPGNATANIRQACVGLAKCNYLVDVNRIGDPASGCGKDFSVTYMCPSGETRTKAIAAEAHGKTVVLDCVTPAKRG